MIGLWILLYMAIGVLIMAALGTRIREFPPSRHPRLTAVVVTGLWIVYVAFWPMGLLALLVQRVEGDRGLSWKIDFEGAELAVRESAARDIERYRDFLTAESAHVASVDEAEKYFGSIFDPIAAIVRNPVVLDKVIAEAESK